MKTWFTLLILLLFVQKTQAFQLDSIFKIDVDVRPEMLEYQGSYFYSFYVDGSILTLNKENKPSKGSMICTLSELQKMYTGSINAYKKRGNLKDFQLIDINGLKFVQMDGTIDIPDGRSNHMSMLTLYFNKIIYNITFVHNPEDQEVAERNKKSIFQSIKVNDYNGTLQQLDRCVPLIDEHDNMAFKIGYTIGNIFVFVGVAIGLYFFAIKYLS